MLGDVSDEILEIQRSVTAAYYKLACGLFMALTAGLLATSTSRDLTGPLMMAVIFGAPAVPAILGALQVIVRKPLGLRATAAGVWFGGGPIIPWHEVTAIYESSPTFQRYGMTAKPGGVALSFRHKRTVLRLPISCWMTTLMLGDVRVSTTLRPELPVALVVKLEAMRAAACGHEDGAMVGASAPAAARVVKRPTR